MCERRAVQSVGVGDARGARGERLAHLDGAADRRRAGGRAVGSSAGALHRSCRLAVAPLRVARVVGEAHPHSDLVSCIARLQYVGRVRAVLQGLADRADPLPPPVGESGVLHSVTVDDPRRFRGERLAHPQRAADDRSAAVLHVQDRPSRLGVAELRASGVAQGERERLVVLLLIIVQERNRDRLRRVARLERQRAARGRVVGPRDRRAVGGGVVHGHRLRRCQVERHHEVDRRILFGGLGVGHRQQANRVRVADRPDPRPLPHLVQIGIVLLPLYRPCTLRPCVVLQSARDELELLLVVLLRVVDDGDADRFFRITRVESHRAARPFVVLALLRMNLDDLPLVVPLVRYFDGDVVHNQPLVVARRRRERQAELHVSAFVRLGVMHPKSIRVFGVELDLQLGGGRGPRIRRRLGGGVFETVVSDAVVIDPARILTVAGGGPQRDRRVVETRPEHDEVEFARVQLDRGVIRSRPSSSELGQPGTLAHPIAVGPVVRVPPEGRDSLVGH